MGHSITGDFLVEFIIDSKDDHNFRHVYSILNLQNSHFFLINQEINRITCPVFEMKRVEIVLGIT